MCVGVGAALTAVSTALGAFGTWQQGKAQQAAYEAEERTKREQAAREATAARYQFDRTRMANDQMLDGARSQYLDSGIALEGSAIDVISAEATTASLDEQAILYNSKLRTDAMQFEADMAKENAKTTKQATILSTAAQVVSGAANAYGQFRSSATARAAAGAASDQAASANAASKDLISRGSGADRSLAIESARDARALGDTQYGRASSLSSRTAAAERRLASRRAGSNRASLMNPFGGF